MWHMILKFCNSEIMPLENQEKKKKEITHKWHKQDKWFMITPRRKSREYMGLNKHGLVKQWFKKHTCKRIKQQKTCS